MGAKSAPKWLNAIFSNKIMILSLLAWQHGLGTYALYSVSELKTSVPLNRSQFHMKNLKCEIRLRSFEHNAGQQKENNKWQCPIHAPYFKTFSDKQIICNRLEFCKNNHAAIRTKEAATENRKKVNKLKDNREKNKRSEKKIVKNTTQKADLGRVWGLCIAIIKPKGSFSSGRRAPSNGARCTQRHKIALCYSWYVAIDVESYLFIYGTMYFITGKKRIRKIVAINQSTHTHTHSPGLVYVHTAYRRVRSYLWCACKL